MTIINRTRDMAQKVKSPAAKPNGISSISKERTN